ncbi:MAG TPA: sel1 repeat family protein [Telluria sp.]|nr:sel1 repeat family protein [Telluria sp.]
MRPFLFALAIAVATPAFANDLAEANRLLEAKSYSQAVPLLTRLAGQGDAAAQLRLGQVYWYGEGVPVDRTRADALFAQAAATGNAEAKQAQGLSARRAQHGADIAYWTGGYDGADLKAARDACVLPAIPAKSETNNEIKAVQASMKTWQDCHNGFVQRVEGLLPAGKAIPEPVLDLMTDEEVERAKVHLGTVYKRISEEAAGGAARTMAAYGAWEKATQGYVAAQNTLAESRERQRREELERMRGMVGPDAKCAGCGGGGGAPRTPPGK